MWKISFGSEGTFRFPVIKQRRLLSLDHGYLLHGHLGHHIKRGEVRAGKTVFVLAHLDRIQPLVHGAEAGEIRDAAVQQGQMNSTQDQSKFIKTQSRPNTFITVLLFWFFSPRMIPERGTTSVAYSWTNIFQTGSSNKHF